MREEEEGREVLKFFLILDFVQKDARLKEYLIKNLFGHDEKDRPNIL